MSRTLEQKIADAEARLQRLKAKSRSLDTAQKVIVGAALLAKVRKPEEVQLRAWLLQFLKAEVTRQAESTLNFRIFLFNRTRCLCEVIHIRRVDGGAL
ncbi:mobilization protein [Escherichia coli]|uniref:mobilization protein n=10 Tax=Pseudomonadota TaxID=1224 RepID=UPI00202DD4E9|nr:mobilization protein [Escherichia coli]